MMKKCKTRKKILFLFSCPRNVNRLRLDEEERVVRECFERASLHDVIDWTSRHAVRIKDMRRAILDEKPNIVHFSGHGTRGTIVLENGYGKPYPVPIDALADYLSDKDLECVIFNACNTKNLGKAISGMITISMRNAISDKAAIKFTEGFYDGIGAGKSIKGAFEEGYSNVLLNRLGKNFSPEYLLPQNRINSESDEFGDGVLASTNNISKKILRSSCMPSNKGFKMKIDELEKIAANAIKSNMSRGSKIATVKLVFKTIRNNYLETINSIIATRGKREIIFAKSKMKRK